MNIRLSYIIPSFNQGQRLAAVCKAIARRQDEEVIVVDGGSTDGSEAVLADLKHRGLVTTVISEPDKGMVHASNKGMLAAHGTLVKIILPPDLYWYAGIRSGLEWMLAHPEVDLLGTEGASVSWERPDPIHASDTKTEYRRYREQGVPFSFSGSGMLIRRNSLPLLGLFNTGLVRSDAEYSLRQTSGRAIVGWYTGYTWARMPEARKISKARLIRETEALNKYHAIMTPNAQSFIDDQPFTRKLRSLLAPIARAITSKASPKAIPEADRLRIVEQWLIEANQTHPGRFL